MVAKESINSIDLIISIKSLPPKIEIMELIKIIRLMEFNEILQLLPYSIPFLFVDELENVDENGVRGNYTFPKNAFFYKGHFKNYPVTPGVILTETMAQIGVVCLGIFLMKDKFLGNDFPKIALTSNTVDFYKPVFPEEKVTVISEKIYSRFGKLKCNVEMRNEANELICKGVIAGMIERI